MGSEVSEAVVPLQGMYSATKHAVKAFTDTLRMELEEAGTPVSVTLVKPGSIEWNAGKTQLKFNVADDHKPESKFVAISSTEIPPQMFRENIGVVTQDTSLLHRSVRENIALPFSARLRNWGPLKIRAERSKVLGAIERLQIDTRAQAEVQRLSGGKTIVVLGYGVQGRGQSLNMRDNGVKVIDRHGHKLSEAAEAAP